VSGKKKVLLVDDDRDFLAVNQHILEAGGYRVVCSCDPEDAVEKMAEHTPQLVITDLMMKSLGSGFSLSEQIKEDPRFGDVPVIIVTAISTCHAFDFAPRTSEDLEAMHADAYFNKPVAPETLLAKVRELLERHREKESA